MRWEDLVKKDVSVLDGRSDWKERASGRDGWKTYIWWDDPSGRISEKEVY